MKITMSWRSNKHVQKKKRVTHKPKIRWQQLGFKDPAEERTPPSMDEIRRQVVRMSMQGVGRSERPRPRVASAQENRPGDHVEPARKRRRGATE